MLLLPLQLQEPSYLAGVLMTLHQLAPENDKLVELQLQTNPLTHPSLASGPNAMSCMSLLLLPLQLQQPSHLAGVLMTLHQLAPENDKLVELLLQTQLSPPESTFTCFQPHCKNKRVM
jgi:hypothetical protein